MAVDLVRLGVFVAGILLGCLAAAATFWIWAIRTRGDGTTQKSGLPVHLGRDLRQAKIVGKEAKDAGVSGKLATTNGSGGSPSRQGFGGRMRGAFSSLVGSPKKVDPTTDVYIPSTRRTISPRQAKPESPQPVTTPRIYVLPVSASGSPHGAIVPAKLDRRSHSSKQGDLIDSPLIHLALPPYHVTSPGYGKQIKVDKVPNRALLGSPVAGEGQEQPTLSRNSEGETSNDVDRETENGQMQDDPDEESPAVSPHLPDYPVDIPIARRIRDADSPVAQASPSSSTKSSTIGAGHNQLAGAGGNSAESIADDPGIDVEVVDSNLDDLVSSLNGANPANGGGMVCMLSIVIEEVLPRPESGLLKRMLRMAEVPVGRVEGSNEPIFSLRVASECHLSVGLITVQSGDVGFDIVGPVRIAVQPLDGELVELQVNCEQVDATEHITTAFWDLKGHGSKLLTSTPASSPSSTSLTPIEFTLGFLVRKPGEKNPTHGISIKKTILGKIRNAAATMDVESPYQYSEKVVGFVLSDMELVSMPSLLMFLKASQKET